MRGRFTRGHLASHSKLPKKVVQLAPPVLPHPRRVQASDHLQDAFPRSVDGAGQAAPTLTLASTSILPRAVPYAVHEGAAPPSVECVSELIASSDEVQKQHHMEAARALVAASALLEGSHRVDVAVAVAVEVVFDKGSPNLVDGMRRARDQPKPRAGRGGNVH